MYGKKSLGSFFHIKKHKNMIKIGDIIILSYLGKNFDNKMWAKITEININGWIKVTREDGHILNTHIDNVIINNENKYIHTQNYLIVKNVTTMSMFEQQVVPYTDKEMPKFNKDDMIDMLEMCDINNVELEQAWLAGQMSEPITIENQLITIDKDIARLIDIKITEEDSDVVSEYISNIIEDYF